MKLTAERITGYILNAGDTMKYGPLVTPFTAENGYSPGAGLSQRQDRGHDRRRRVPGELDALRGGAVREP